MDKKCHSGSLVANHRGRTSIEQYVRSENVSTFGLEKDADENVFAKVVSVAEKAGENITANDVSTSHRLPS